MNPTRLRQTIYGIFFLSIIFLLTPCTAASTELATEEKDSLTEQSESKKEKKESVTQRTKKILKIVAVASTLLAISLGGSFLLFPRKTKKGNSNKRKPRLSSEKGKEWFKAIEKSDLGKLKAIYNSYIVDVNKLDSNQVRSIHKAIKKGNTQIAKWLINQGADATATDQDECERTLLHYISEFSKPEFFNELESILNTEALKELVNQPDKLGRTPLHYTVYNKNATAEEKAEMANWLIQKGADIKAQDNQGNNPIHIALNKLKTPEVFTRGIVIALQRKYGKDINQFKKLMQNLEEQVNNAGESIKSTTWSRSKFFSKEWFDAIDAIKKEDGIEKLEGIWNKFNDKFGVKIDLNQVDDKGIRPLHKAIEKGNLQIAEWLINQGADATATDQDECERTLLHYIAKYSKPEFVNELESIINTEALKKLVNQQDQRGRTPLHYTAYNKHASAEKIANWLIQKGALLKQTDKSKKTLLHYIAWQSGPEFLKKLEPIMKAKELEQLVKQEDRRGRTPLHYTAYNEHANAEEKVEMARWLIQKGALLNKADKSKKTLLHYIAWQSGPEFLKKLEPIVEAEVLEQLVNQQDQKGRTPLHYTAYNEHASAEEKVEMARWLIQKGALLNKADNSKKTLLHYIAWQSKPEFLKKLEPIMKAKVLEQLVNQQDQKGRTPLHYIEYNKNATEEEKGEMISWLIEKGADLMKTDYSGRKIDFELIPKKNKPTAKSGWVPFFG